MSCPIRLRNTTDLNQAVFRTPASRPLTPIGSSGINPDDTRLPQRQGRRIRRSAGARQQQQPGIVRMISLLKRPKLTAGDL
jgi:hypothetical protein